MKKKPAYIVLFILFCIYWIFAVYFTFATSGFAQQIKQSSIGQTLFPPTYKMYTSPPKQIIQTKYLFYHQGKEIKTIDVDELYGKRLKDEFPNPILKKDVKNYLKIYYLPNVNLGNDVYKYALDSLVQKEKTLQEYLLSKKENVRYVENQLDIAQNIQPSNADSVVVVIHRKFNEVQGDDSKQNKLAYWITDSILVKKGKKLNNAPK